MLSLGQNPYDSDNSASETMSLTPGNDDFNCHYHLNSSDSLFPALHLLFILNPSDLNGILSPVQRERNVFPCGR